MQQELSKIKDERISLVKLLVAAAILAIAAHTIYEMLSVEKFSEEIVLNEKISIHFNDLVLSFLAEFFFFYLTTFLILLGIRFLYLYFTYHNENKII